VGGFGRAAASQSVVCVKRLLDDSGRTGVRPDTGAGVRGDALLVAAHLNAGVALHRFAFPPGRRVDAWLQRGLPSL
jgi:hypothetical protein